MYVPVYRELPSAREVLGCSSHSLVGFLTDWCMVGVTGVRTCLQGTPVSQRGVGPSSGHSPVDSQGGARSSSGQTE